MICDSCGKEFHEEPTFDTTSKEGGRGVYVRNTREVPILLCPECAARRRRLPSFLLIAICLTIGALAVIGYLLKW
jgi:hypothetical protein